MSFRLDADARYYTAGDYTAVSIYFVEDSTLAGTYVDTGSVELRSEDTRRTLSSIDFVKQHMNDDGFYIVLFLHPPQYMNTKIHIEVTDVNGLEYTKEVPVVFVAATDTGLADTPSTQVEYIGTIESGASDQFDIFDARRDADLDLES